MSDWHRRRVDKDVFGNDYRGQFDTQLNAVTSEVDAAIAAVQKSLGLDLATLTPAQVYATLARIDRQIVWIRRAWDFFRAKFDQRDSESLARALAAADEVLWSCYKPFFQRAGVARPPLH